MKPMAMDVPRKDAARRKWIRRGLFAGAVVIVVPAISITLGRMKPASPIVEASSVWPDTVKRGEMVVQHRGLGSLVAEEILFVAAVTEGRVRKILVRPGTLVGVETVIVQLTSPELEQLTLDAEYALKSGEAKLKDLQVTLVSQTLTQRAELARLETELTQAKLNYELQDALFKEGLVKPLPYKLAQANFADLTKRYALEQERLTIRKDSVEAQLAVQAADIDKLRAMYGLRNSLA